MSILNPNNTNFDEDYITTSGLTSPKQGTTRITTLGRRQSKAVGDIRPLALIEVSKDGTGVSITGCMDAEESFYVLTCMDAFLANNKSLTISQKAFACLSVPSNIDNLWKVLMEVSSDNTSTGNVTRLQLRSFKSILDYLEVNKAGDGIITISR